jgi:hypothetical protein
MVRKMITDTFIPNGNMTELQKNYLYDNVLDAVEENIKNNFRQIITFSADTGQGKTWMIINYLIPAIAKKGLNNFLYISPEVGVTKQTRLDAQTVLDMTVVDGKPVKVIDENQIKSYVNGTLKLKKNVIYVFFTTKQYFLKNQDTFTKGCLSPSNVGEWGVFDDEAHQHTGTWDLEDVLPNTGRNNKKAKLSTARALRAFCRAGANIIAISATLTNSQKGKTVKGKKLFNKLPTMPRDSILTTFGDFTSISAVNNIGDWSFANMIIQGLDMFAKHRDEVVNLHNSITTETWKILNTTDSKFAKAMPDLIIKTGMDNATNGLRYKDCIGYIKKFAKSNNFILVDLVENTYAGKFVNNTGDMISIINNSPMHSHIIVVKEKLNVGANISTLTHAIVVRSPTSKIHNNYSQFLGRLTRMPFFRSHAEAKSFIHGLDISFEQKALLINYYAVMNWAHAIVPKESELLSSRINVDDDVDFDNETVMDFRLRGVWSLMQGKEYLFQGLNESCIDKQKFNISSSLTVTQQNFIKEKFCAGCPRDENNLPKCLANVYEALSKVYGFRTYEEFFEYIDKSMLVREHKNGNHYDNDPENIAFVCANLSAVKTDLYKDNQQRYDWINGQMVPRKLNNICV